MKQLLISTLIFICFLLVFCSDDEESKATPMYDATFRVNGIDKTFTGGHFNYSEEDARWGATWNMGESGINELYIRLPEEVSAGTTYTNADSGDFFQVMYRDENGTRSQVAASTSFTLTISEWSTRTKGTFYGTLETEDGGTVTLSEGSFDGEI